MILNGAKELILLYFTEFGIRGVGLYCVKAVEDVVVKSSRSLSHILMSFLSLLCSTQLDIFWIIF